MRLVKASFAFLPIGLAVLFTSGRASAIGYEEPSAKGKAIVGCGLLGAELVLVTEAAIGVQNPWLYVGGGVVGAVGGALGGYALEQNDLSPRTSMILLAAGLTLAIPTTVAVLSATAYEPPADYLEDKPPADEPLADPPQPAPPGATPATPSTTPTAPATSPTGAAPRRQRVVHRTAVLPPLRLTPPAIVDFTPDMLALSIPALEIRGAYSEREIAMYGVRQTTEFHLPVLSVVF
ncbi:MAG TPA: hypothetical protein VMS65_12940 [Polyangiaceae bacterium]|nr:hypothetical protein [Polyangiaceae bacterium]